MQIRHEIHSAYQIGSDRTALQAVGRVGIDDAFQEGPLAMWTSIFNGVSCHKETGKYRERIVTHFYPSVVSNSKKLVTTSRGCGTSK